MKKEKENSKREEEREITGYLSIFPSSSVFSSLAALIFSSLTNFPPFFAFDFEFNSIEYNNKLQDLETRQDVQE